MTGSGKRDDRSCTTGATCLCINTGPVEYRKVEPRCPSHGPEGIALARIARARADRNRQVNHGMLISRVDGRHLHEIRIDDRRGNFKECVGLYEPSECPICAEREGEDGRVRIV